jgi:YegS/Rv2252/BmrU family lipid kinase
MIVDIVVVHSSTDATDAARNGAQWADVVVAVGGDGTVADVATGLFGSPAALGILPAGSTNITARALGIPANAAAAAALIAGPHQRRAIDVGRSGSRSFLHIAGAGFDAELFKGADPRWKRRIGWLAYVPPAVAALRLQPSRVRILADGQPIEASSALVLVANGGSAVTPQFSIYPGIAVDDGWLDLLVFTASTPIEVAATLASAGRQRLGVSPHVIRRQAKHISIEAEPSLGVQLDGDPRGRTPREFHVAPAALQVITSKS